MGGFIGWLASGAIAPFLDFGKSIVGIFTHKMDTDVEKFKVSGVTDVALIEAQCRIVLANAELLKNKWLVALQVMFATPLALYYGKCLVYDKMFALGSTDALGGDISTWSMWIVGFLFMHASIMSLGRKT